MAEELRSFVENYVAPNRRARFLRLLEHRHGPYSIAKELCHPESFISNRLAKCTLQELESGKGAHAFDEFILRVKAAGGGQSCYVLTCDGEESRTGLFAALELVTDRGGLAVFDPPELVLVVGEYAIFLSQSLMSSSQSRRNSKGLHDAKR